MEARINVVLFEPEIAPNTGNIMRTCVAAGCKLHIIKPLGFDIESKEIRRSTTNHITFADYTLYENYEDFVSKNDGEFFFMTRYGKVPPSDIKFGEIPSDRKIYLIFGKESTGIRTDILRENLDRCFRIPMTADCRCLNLSNSAAIVIYECLRQLGYPGLSFTEVQKGENFLENEVENKESYDEAIIRRKK